MTPAITLKLFADGADPAQMRALAALPHIAGLTTNPSLMHKAGVRDYLGFVREAVRDMPDKPISFEIFADDWVEAERQARVLAACGPNVYVKIPIANTRRESSAPLIRRLSADGIPLNVTAIFTLEQVCESVAALSAGVPAVISVFAGRLADSGRDPEPVMRAAAAFTRMQAGCELLWAGTREVWNIFQAQTCGCDIITVPPDVLAKLTTLGRDPVDFSHETVCNFASDAASAGYTL